MSPPTDVPSLLARLPTRGSLIGLDLSKRRIGLAGTDPDRRLVTPLDVWQRAKLSADAERLRELITAREAIALIVGLPLRPDGSFGPEAQAARDTGRTLAELVDLPIGLADERYTTVEAQARFGRAANDAHAAAIILEDALGLSSGAPPIG